MSEESISEPTVGSESHKTEEPLITHTGSPLSATYYAALKAPKIDFDRGKQIPLEERIRIANERMKLQRTRVPLPEIPPPPQP